MTTSLFDFNLAVTVDSTISQLACKNNVQESAVTILGKLLQKPDSFFVAKCFLRTIKRIKNFYTIHFWNFYDSASCLKPKHHCFNYNSTRRKVNESSGKMISVK